MNKADHECVDDTEVIFYFQIICTEIENEICSYK